MSDVYTGLDFFLDGVSAAGKGIVMQAEPTISPIEANLETIEIPGRSGSLHIADGTYKDRTITIPCYAVGYNSTRDNGYYTGGDGVYAVMATINAFLFPVPNSGYVPIRKLKIGYTNTYWKVMITNGAEIQARIKTLNPFNIEFTAEPFRYYISGDTRAGL